MIDLLLSHKTIRRYTAQAVDDATLHKILEAGIRAANTGNMQLYSIVVTRNEEQKQKLAPAHFNQPSATTAPVVLTICADINRFEQWCQQRNAEPGFRNFESFLTATIDASLLAQNINIAAEALGLGVCYLGTTTYNPHQIIETLQLPSGVFPVTTLTIGYPAEQPNLTDRLPLESVVHYETYAQPTPQEIDYWYESKENLPESLQFLEANKKETLAQIYTDVRYPRKNNEYFSEILFNTVMAQGFAFPK